MRKRVLLHMCGQQKLISAYAPAQSNWSRCKHAPILCAYILTTHVLFVRPIIARCNEFCAPFNRFQLFKKDGRVVLNGCVQRNRELHRRRIRTRNLMYSNRASVITWDCMSEINCKQSNCSWHLTF